MEESKNPPYLCISKRKKEQHKAQITRQEISQIHSEDRVETHKDLPTEEELNNNIELRLNEYKAYSF